MVTTGSSCTELTINHINGLRYSLIFISYYLGLAQKHFLQGFKELGTVSTAAKSHYTYTQRSTTNSSQHIEHLITQPGNNSFPHQSTERGYTTR